MPKSTQIATDSPTTAAAARTMSVTLKACQAVAFSPLDRVPRQEAGDEQAEASDCPDQLAQPQTTVQ